MNRFILLTVASFVLSACSSGSVTATKVSYQSATSELIKKQ